MQRATINVGTIGHIDHGRSVVRQALLAIAAAGVLQAAPPAVMPARRRDFEHGYDMNDMLADAGDRHSRQLRKNDRKARMRAAGAKAFTEGARP